MSCLLFFLFCFLLPFFFPYLLLLLCSRYPYCSTSPTLTAPHPLLLTALLPLLFTYRLRLTLYPAIPTLLTLLPLLYLSYLCLLDYPTVIYWFTLPTTYHLTPIRPSTTASKQTVALDARRVTLFCKAKRKSPRRICLSFTINLVINISK